MPVIFHSLLRYFCPVVLSVLVACDTEPSQPSDTFVPDVGDADQVEQPEADIPVEGVCLSDLDCSNGSVCDGEERCTDGECMPGSPPGCDDGDPCTLDVCDEGLAGCSSTLRDDDGDGYLAHQAPDGTSCGGDDCDDLSQFVHPGAALDCTGGLDMDCDGKPDMDEDLDGFVSSGCADGDDCDDGADDVYPGAVRQCEDVDHDCNGHGDLDNDGDASIGEGCGGDDCDDEDAEIFPLHDEILCNGIDDNCDGYFSPAEDRDIDGYISVACGGLDCEDRDRNVNPGAIDVCNGMDDDCSGTCDDGFECCLGMLGVACASVAGPPGTRDCMDGCVWSTCCTTLDYCDNGFDDDCDSHTDELEVLVSDTRLTFSTGYSQYPSMAWTGSEYGVIWNDSREGKDELFFTRLDGLGVPQGDPIRETFTPYDSWGPDIAWTGSKYAFVWYESPDTEHRQVHFAQMDASGIRTGPDRQVTTGTGESNEPVLRWTGSEFGVAWWTSTGEWVDVNFTRLSADGTELMSPIWLNEIPCSIYISDIAWTGSEFAVAWTNGWAIYVSRVSASGVKSGASIQVSATGTGAWEPSLAWDGSAYAVAWQDTRFGGSEIMFARMVDGVPGAEMRVTEAYGASNAPSLVVSGTGYRGVYADERDANLELYVSRISFDGDLIGSADRITYASGQAYSPDAVWTGSTLSVAWWDSRDSAWAVYFSQVGCL